MPVKQFIKRALGSMEPLRDFIRNKLLETEAECG
jgi:hypothetical protein